MSVDDHRISKKPGAQPDDPCGCYRRIGHKDEAGPLPQENPKGAKRLQNIFHRSEDGYLELQVVDEVGTGADAIGDGIASPAIGIPGDEDPFARADRYRPLRTISSAIRPGHVRMSHCFSHGVTWGTFSARLSLLRANDISARPSASRYALSSFSWTTDMEYSLSTVERFRAPWARNVSGEANSPSTALNSFSRSPGGIKTPPSPAPSIS